jgi:hypothetical protein
MIVRIMVVAAHAVVVRQTHFPPAPLRIREQHVPRYALLLTIDPLGARQQEAQEW